MLGIITLQILANIYFSTFVWVCNYLTIDKIGEWSVHIDRNVLPIQKVYCLDVTLNHIALFEKN